MNKFKSLVIQKWIPLFLSGLSKKEDVKDELKEETKEELELESKDEKQEEQKDQKSNFDSSNTEWENLDFGNKDDKGDDDPLDNKRLKESTLKSFTKKASDGSEEVIQSIHKLESNFKQIREEVDSSFANKLEMSVEEFRSFIKAEDWLEEVEHLAESLEKIASALNFLKISQAAPLDNILNIKAPVSPVVIDQQKSKENQKRIQKINADEKRIPEILKGKFIFPKTDPKTKRRTLELLTATKLKDSWSTMQQELKLDYTFLVEQLIMLYKSKKTLSKKEINKNNKTSEKMLEDLNRGISKLQRGN
jgi:hypothetical protein